MQSFTEFRVRWEYGQMFCLLQMQFRFQIIYCQFVLSERNAQSRVLNFFNRVIHFNQFRQHASDEHHSLLNLLVVHLLDQCYLFFDKLGIALDVRCDAHAEPV